MNARLNPSRLLQVAGFLLTATGVALVLAVALATEVVVGVALLLAALFLVAAGAGLLLRQVWGWYLALFAALSGSVVVMARLLAGGASEASVLATLCADLLLVAVLLWERPRPAAPPSGMGL
jgi:hypothetical protein